MNLIRINEAEAIIEPFFDGATSDYEDPDPRYRVLDEYRIQTLNGGCAALKQGWAFAELTVETAVPGAPILHMERSCDLDVSGYDTFLLFASLPQCVSFTLTAVLDGKPVELCCGVNGTGASDEYALPFSGRHLTGISLTFGSEQSGVQGTLGWFGLSHSGRLQQMLQNRDQYDPAWPGYFASRCPADPRPEIGILFDGTELDALRQKLAKSPFRENYARKKAQALQDMQIQPESYIGRYVPYFDRRWNRSRDKAKVRDLTLNASGMHTVIENLAFVGIVEGNEQMLRMAARHAFAIAHCEYWCESPMGNLPGATWHHRSFTENNFCRCVALVLDWCGSLMTPFAKQVLRDALVMKGLPRIESDFKRVEYIRYINQGIVFSEGRIYALLALLPRYPRYADSVAEAERDLTQMVRDYIQPDGGTLEGPGYWMFTFSEVVGAFYALARYHREPFTRYRDLFEKTGDYALSMLSMEGEGTILLPVNDAHPQTCMACGLASSMFQFTGNARWKNLYESLLEKGKLDNGSFSLIVSPEPTGQVEAREPLERIYPVTGQADTLRRGILTTRLHLCTGPTYATHFHEDKGSLILEAEGQTLCPDPGSANYFESDLFALGFPRSHSLLNPLMPGGVIARQGRFEQGGRLCKAEVRDQWVEFVSDDTAAWSGQPYTLVQRRILSPAPELFLVEDHFALDKAQGVEFLLNSFAPWKVEEQDARADFGGFALRLRPLNWQWDGVQIRPMQDGEHRPIWQLAASCCGKAQGRLITALWLERPQAPAGLTGQAPTWVFAMGETIFRVTEGTSGIEAASGKDDGPHSL